MGSIGMRAAQWRTVMQLPSTSVSSCILELMRQRAVHMFGATVATFRAPDHWRDDQHFISILLQSGFAQDMMIVNRNTESDRIDRSQWPSASCFGVLAESGNDAHIMFPGEGGRENWWDGELQMLFRTLVPQRYWERADQYVQDYFSATRDQKRQ